MPAVFAVLFFVFPPSAEAAEASSGIFHIPRSSEDSLTPKKRRVSERDPAPAPKAKPGTELKDRLKSLLNGPFVDENRYKEEFAAASLPPGEKPKLTELFKDIEVHSDFVRSKRQPSESCDVPFKSIGFEGEFSDSLDGLANRLRVLWEVARQRVNATKGERYDTPADYYLAIRLEFLSLVGVEPTKKKGDKDKDAKIADTEEKPGAPDKSDESARKEKEARERQMDIARKFARYMALGPEGLMMTLRKHEAIGGDAHDCESALGRNLARRVYETPEVKKLVRLAKVSEATAIMALHGHSAAFSKGNTFAAVDDTSKRLAVIVAKFPRLDLKTQLDIVKLLNKHFETFGIDQTPPVVAEPAKSSPAGRIWGNAVALRIALAREISSRRSSGGTLKETKPPPEERELLDLLAQVDGVEGDREAGNTVFNESRKLTGQMNKVVGLREFAGKVSELPNAELPKKMKEVTGELEKLAKDSLRPAYFHDEKLSLELVVDLVCGTGDWEETVQLAEKAHRIQSGKTPDAREAFCGKSMSPPPGPMLASPGKFSPPATGMIGGVGFPPAPRPAPGPGQGSGGGTPPGPGGSPTGSESPTSPASPGFRPVVRDPAVSALRARYGTYGGVGVSGSRGGYFGYGSDVFGGNTTTRLDGGGRTVELGFGQPADPTSTPTTASVSKQAPEPRQSTTEVTPTPTTRATTAAPSGPTPTREAMGPFQPTRTPTPRATPTSTSPSPTPTTAQSSLPPPTPTASPTPLPDAVNFNLEGFDDSGPHVLVDGVRVPIDPKTGMPITDRLPGVVRKPSSLTGGVGTPGMGGGALPGTSPSVSGQSPVTINNNYVSYGGGTGTTGGFGASNTLDGFKTKLNEATALGTDALPPGAKGPTKRRGMPGSEPEAPYGSAVSIPGVDAPYTFGWIKARPIYDPKNYQNLLWYESDRWRGARKTDAQASDTERVSVQTERGDERTEETNPLEGADKIPLRESVTYLDKTTGNVRGQAEYRESENGKDKLVRVAELHPDDVGKGANAKKTVKRRTERTTQKEDGSTVVVTVEFEEEYPGDGKPPIVKNKKVTTTTQPRRGTKVTELVEDIVEAGFVVGTKTTITEGAEKTVVIRRRNRTTGEEVVETFTTRDDRKRIRLWKPDERI